VAIDMEMMSISAHVVIMHGGPLDSRYCTSMSGVTHAFSQHTARMSACWPG
jgi:hypothetical protein